MRVLPSAGLLVIPYWLVVGTSFWIAIYYAIKKKWYYSKKR